MKRVLALVFIFALLSACAPAGGSDPAISPNNGTTAALLLQHMLAAAPESGEAPEIVAEEALPLCLELYGISAETVADRAVARLGGARVFELAVIHLTAPSLDAAEALRSYRDRRWADFSGYAPDQAAIAEDGVIALDESGCWLALILSQDSGAVAEAFFACLGGERPEPTPESTPEPLPEPTPTPSESPYVPPGRLLYVDPNIDDMTIYDTSAILAAWESGDDSALSDFDRAILDRCRQVISKVIQEDMTPLKKETAIYRWMVNSIVYDNDHYDPFVQMSPNSLNPYGPLIHGKGVCLGYATTFQLFMDMLDVECITVVGAANLSLEDHAWNMVRLNGNWYCVDVTWDAGVSQRYWRYFNVTSDWMADHNHQWDYSAIPEATATDHGKA